MRATRRARSLLPDTSPPKIPLIPASRPVSSISNGASPISAPPIAAEMGEQTSSLSDRAPAIWPNGVPPVGGPGAFGDQWARAGGLFPCIDPALNGKRGRKSRPVPPARPWPSVRRRRSRTPPVCWSPTQARAACHRAAHGRLRSGRSVQRACDDAVLLTLVVFTQIDQCHFRPSH